MLRKLNTYYKTASQVRAVYGASFFKQIYEIIKVGFGRFRLSPSEYYDFALYDSGLYSPIDKFVGWRSLSPLAFGLNDEAFVGLLIDKLTTYRLLDSCGLPIPTTLAVYSPSLRTVGDAKILRTKSDVVRWLRNQQKFPIYGKSSHGSYGSTNILIRSCDPALDKFHLQGEGFCTANDVLNRIGNIRNLGYLFQENLRPSRECCQIFGDRLIGLRVVVLCPPEREARLHRAVIKIPKADNISDNFSHGRNGNLLGAIDLQSGKIIRVVACIGVGNREIETDPETGAELGGFTIPCWNEVRSVVLEGCKLFPGLHVQGWDVALTERGPVVLEVNYFGDVDLHQIAYGKGYIDTDFERFVGDMGGWERVLNYKMDRRAKRVYRENTRFYERLGLDKKAQGF